MNDILITISEQIIVPALNILSVAAIGYAVSWLRKKAKNEKHKSLEDALFFVEDLASSVVLATNQTIVDGLKKEGKFTPEIALDIKRQVTETVLAQSGKARVIIEQAGMDFSRYLSDTIEKEVYSIKK